MLFNLLASLEGKSHVDAEVIYEYLGRSREAWIEFDIENKDTWPRNLVDVLACDEGGMWEDYFDVDKKAWASKQPTHWMHAPELPKR